MSSHALTDTLTLLRRNLRHTLRYPSMTIGSVFGPVIMLLLFVGVLGRTLGAGLASAAGHATAHGGGYIGYIAPGIIITAVASGSMATAVAVCVDMTEGIVDRFRTMPIARVAVLAAHVINSVLTTLVSTASVIGVSIALGFRPHADVAHWLAAGGLLLALTVSLTWLAVAMGLVSDTPEAASNAPMLIVFLPFIGSAFAPASSMPVGVRQFAEYQPFTPAIETIRGLLTGAPIGNNAVIALVWCAVLGGAGFAWAMASFKQGRAH